MNEITGLRETGGTEGETTEAKLEIVDPAKDPREIESKKKTMSKTLSTLENSAGKLKGRPSAMTKKYASVKEKIETIRIDDNIPKIVLSEKDKEVLRNLEIEHEKKISREASITPAVSSTTTEIKQTIGERQNFEERVEKNEKISARPSVRPRQTVSQIINYLLEIFADFKF